MTIVCNTSPITNLAAIAQLDLLRQLYSEIVIPQAVYDELAVLPNPVPGTVDFYKERSLIYLLCLIHSLVYGFQYH